MKSPLSTLVYKYTIYESVIKYIFIKLSVYGWVLFMV